MSERKNNDMLGVILDAQCCLATKAVMLLLYFAINSAIIYFIYIGLRWLDGMGLFIPALAGIAGLGFALSMIYLAWRDR